MPQLKGTRFNKLPGKGYLVAHGEVTDEYVAMVEC
jgi:hypothetical protein